MITTEKPAKLIGAYKHLLLQLKKVNAIDDIDADHLLDRYIRGHITGFGHLAEWLLATGSIGGHNYDQIIYYGRKYGENR